MVLAISWPEKKAQYDALVKANPPLEGYDRPNFLEKFKAADLTGKLFDKGSFSRHQSGAGV
jgi:hypothetical protein